MYREKQSDEPTMQMTKQAKKGKNSYFRLIKYRKVGSMKRMLTIWSRVRSGYWAAEYVQQM